MKVKIAEVSKRTVLDFLRDEGIAIDTPCGGKGTCGKCKVKVSDHIHPIDEQEARLLGESNIKAGYRLACKLPCNGEVEVEIDEEEASFYIESSYEEAPTKQREEVQGQYGVAIDIGTTTLALELVELGTGKTKGVYTSLNSGRKYGADVISRIDYATQNGVERLQKAMQTDLIKGIETLCGQHHLEVNAMKDIVIVGNTTMLHILMGADCKGLGIYPFKPVFLDKVEIERHKLFERKELTGSATLLPSLSTYVGADIVSGILKCGMHETHEVTMLIDIGTNGEMVIGNNERLISLATAAGPAFEGGNIQCGIGSVRGAICQAVYDKGEFVVETIEHAKAVGICGSGLIDLVAQALKHGLIDETGCIEVGDAIQIVGESGIVLTQKDMRQFQLAKAAIRAGIELLLKNYGIKAEEVTKVYLAGGFGKFINLENAFEIGLLPIGFQHKVQRVGNTALGGAKKYLLDGDIHPNQATETIQKIHHELHLANDPEFNHYFIEAMLFENY